MIEWLLKLDMSTPSATVNSIATALGVPSGSNRSSFYDIYNDMSVASIPAYITGGTTVPWLVRVAAQLAVSSALNFVKVGIGSHTGINSNLITSSSLMITPYLE